MSIAKLLRTALFTEHIQWLLLSKLLKMSYQMAVACTLSFLNVGGDKPFLPRPSILFPVIKILQVNSLSENSSSNKPIVSQDTCPGTANFHPIFHIQRYSSTTNSHNECFEIDKKLNPFSVAT